MYTCLRMYIVLSVKYIVGYVWKPTNNLIVYWQNIYNVHNVAIKCDPAHEVQVSSLCLVILTDLGIIPFAEFEMQC